MPDPVVHHGNCKTCQHPRRQAIERAWLAGRETKATIARRHKLDVQAITRHMKAHVGDLARAEIISEARTERAQAVVEKLNMQDLSIEEGLKRVLGEVDYNAAPFLLHEHAIYIHNAVTYYVEKLEWERRTAYVRQRTVDYYTDAESSSNIQVLSIDQEIAGGDDNPMTARRFGDVSVATVVAKFKKVKFETHESIGYGEVGRAMLGLDPQALMI